MYKRFTKVLKEGKSTVARRNCLKQFVVFRKCLVFEYE